MFDDQTDSRKIILTYLPTSFRLFRPGSISTKEEVIVEVSLPSSRSNVNVKLKKYMYIYIYIYCRKAEKSTLRDDRLRYDSPFPGFGINILE